MRDNNNANEKNEEEYLEGFADSEIKNVELNEVDRRILDEEKENETTQSLDILVERASDGSDESENVESVDKSEQEKIAENVVEKNAEFIGKVSDLLNVLLQIVEKKIQKNEGIKIKESFQDENENANDGKFEINAVEEIIHTDKKEQEFNAENIDKKTQDANEIKFNENLWKLRNVLAQIVEKKKNTDSDISEKKQSESIEKDEKKFIESLEMVERNSVEENENCMKITNIEFDIKTQILAVEFDIKTQEKNDVIVELAENNITENVIPKIEIKNEDLEDAELEEFFKFYEIIYDEIIYDVAGKNVKIRDYYSNEIYDYYCSDCRDEGRKIIEKDLFFEKFDERFNVKH